MDDQGSCLSGDVTDVLVLWCFLLSEQGWSSSSENLNVETPASPKKRHHHNKHQPRTEDYRPTKTLTLWIGRTHLSHPLPVTFLIITFRSSSLVLLRPRHPQ